MSSQHVTWINQRMREQTVEFIWSFYTRALKPQDKQGKMQQIKTFEDKLFAQTVLKKQGLSHYKTQIVYALHKQFPNDGTLTEKEHKIENFWKVRLKRSAPVDTMTDHVYKKRRIDKGNNNYAHVANLPRIGRALKEWDKDFNAFLNEAPGNHMYREGALKIKRECSEMYKKLQEGHAAEPNVQKELRLVQLNAKQMCKKLHHELLRIRKNRDIAPGWRGLTSSLDELTVERKRIASEAIADVIKFTNHHLSSENLIVEEVNDILKDVCPFDPEIESNLISRRI